MDAIRLLKIDHAKVKKLLHRLGETTERAVKGRHELFAIEDAFAKYAVPRSLCASARRESARNARR